MCRNFDRYRFGCLRKHECKHEWGQALSFASSWRNGKSSFQSECFRSLVSVDCSHLPAGQKARPHHLCVFVEGDEYLDSDAVFGVKHSLVVAFKPHPAGLEPDGKKSAVPFCTAEFYFKLVLS